MGELNLHRAGSAQFGPVGSWKAPEASRIRVGAHPPDEMRVTGTDIAQSYEIKKINLADRQVRMGSELESRARWAVVKSNLKELRRVLELGANPAKADESGDTFLHTAARLGSGKVGAEMVSLLLSHKVAIDTVNAQGRSALHEAAEAGHLNIVKQLIKAGANATVQDVRGLTALDLAQMHEHASVHKYLSLGKS